MSGHGRGMNNAVPPLSADELAVQFADLHPPLAPQAAFVEASRCLFCFDAPCSTACPTHIDVPRFIKKIATGNVRGSALTILESNILGLSCSRVCPVDVLCEGACVLHRYNKEPIEIGRLQRHAMEWWHGKRELWSEFYPRDFSAGTVACIGAGPASLACAAELRRQGFRVTVFDRRPLPGGLNTYGVAEYKLRPSDAQKEIEMLRAMGIEFRNGVEIGKDVSLEEIESKFDFIFLGVGLGPTQALGIEGENLRGVTDAVTFIAQYKTGIAKVGRRVAVIGGGNTAIDAACAARRLGAGAVTIVYRRSEHDMPAFRFEFEHAKKDGIGFAWEMQPVSIGGHDAVERLNCVSKNGSGNLEIPCDMVIVAIGQSKLLRSLAESRGIALENGRVQVESATGETTNPRYFAGGDCVNGGREVVDAVAAGARAGRAIAERFVQSNRGVA